MIESDIKISPTISFLVKSLVKVQGLLETVSKSTQAYKYKYANLATIIESFRPLLAEHGLCLLQAPTGSKDEMFMTSLLCHESGEWMQFKTPMVTSLKDPQTVGSAITYFRRYCVSSILNIASDESDDDGKRATDAMQKEEAKKQTEYSEVLNPVVIPTITEEQVQYLMNLCNQVQPLYYKNILIPKMNSLKLESISEIPVPMFKNVEAFIKRSLEEKTRT